jgi:hypothetical protein
LKGSVTTLPASAAALTERDYKLLESSCISSKLATAAGIFRVDSFEGARIVGRKASADYDYSGIVFPYHWPGDTSAREYRLRRDSPDEELQPDGSVKESAKYLGPPGRGSMLYFPPDVDRAWLDDPDMPIVIVEGEKKTLAMWLLAWFEVNGPRPRFLPIGVPGVWNWRGKIGKKEQPDGSTRPVRGPISDLPRIAWSGRTSIIIFDANLRLNESVKAARDGLAYWLKQYGSDVLFVDLPQIGDVNGPDDLMYLKGPEYMLDILSKAYSGVYPEAQSASEHFAIRDWAGMDDIASLMMAEWGWDDDDKQTFRAINSTWGGRRTKTFRTIHLTIYKRLKKLPDDASVSDCKQAQRFVRDRIKKLLRTIDNTVTVPIVEIKERGGQINPKTGKHLGTKYQITHSPFLEAKREAARLMQNREVASPGLAREIAAKLVAADYVLPREQAEVKQEHRARAARLASDAVAAQVSFEKKMKKWAEAVAQKMFDEGYTRAEIMNYFCQQSAKLAEFGQKKLKHHSSEAIHLEEDTGENSEFMGTVERSHSEPYPPYPLNGEESKHTDSSHVSSFPYMKRGNNSSGAEFGCCPSCGADGIRFKHCVRCGEVLR